MIIIIKSLFKKLLKFVILADAVTAFFNGNPRLVLDIASPIVDDTAAAVAKGLASRALTTLTKDEILPYKSK